MNSFAALQDTDAADEAIRDASEGFDWQRAAVCTQHSILVLDASGSMREADCHSHGRNIPRIEALYDALRCGFVQPQLDAGIPPSELVSVVRMQDSADILLQCAPFADVADLPHLQPASHGNYLPALAKLHSLIQTVEAARAQGSEAGLPVPPTMSTCVLFLSDGRPSDVVLARDRKSETRDPRLVSTAVCSSVRRLWYMLNERERAASTFRFVCVGFGREDFSVLRKMVEDLPKSVGIFREATLDEGSLLDSLATFSETVTSTRLTSTGGGPRVMRAVEKLMHSEDGTLVAFSCYRCEVYHVPATWSANIAKGQLSKKRRGQIQPVPGDRLAAISDGFFGSGGERNVFHMRLATRRSGPRLDEKQMSLFDFAVVRDEVVGWLSNARMSTPHRPYCRQARRFGFKG